MQDPKKEIPAIVRTLYTTRDGVELEETVNKYYSPKATFSHPLCKANSRNEILGLFQWCRLASPKAEVKISSVMYDPETNVVVFDVKERLNVWFVPLSGKVGRMVVRLQLQKVNGCLVIVREDDLVHPTDQMMSIAAPLAPLVDVCLRLGCLASNFGACVFRTVGLNAGLRGGTVNYAGLMEAVGLARTSA